MTFSHSPDVWTDFPKLAVAVAWVDAVREWPDLSPFTTRHLDAARVRLTQVTSAGQAPLTEGQWPEIQAWRRVYTQMGFSATQVRCAAEALLRRLRQDGTLPSLHPLVDLCNALSVHAALPVAVFDADQVQWPLMVRRAVGDETYLSFAGETEHPLPGEIIFADARGQAHARKWAHRQSRLSAISAQTRRALIVMEAFHDEAPQAIARALAWLEEALNAGGAGAPGPRVQRAFLSATDPVFEVAGSDRV